MKDKPPPARPEIGFVVALIRHFVDAWVSRERLAREAGFSYTERLQLSLTRRGYTPEAAAEEISRRNAEAEQRARNRAEVREAARIIRIAQRIRPWPVPGRNEEMSRPRTPLPNVAHLVDSQRLHDARTSNECSANPGC